MEWAAVISGALTIIALLLKAYLNRDKNDEQTEAIQEKRQDIVDGDVAAIESRIDELLTNADGSAAGIESAEDAERRIGNL